MDANGNQLPYEANGCARPLPLNAKISMKVSTGACQVAPPAQKDVTVPDTLRSSSDFVLWASQNGITITETTAEHTSPGCELLNEDWSATGKNPGSYCAFNGQTLTTGKTYILRKFVEPAPEPTGTAGSETVETSNN